MRRALVEYSVAVVVTAAAVALRWVLNPLLGHRLPDITLFGAVAVATWLAGWRPAALVSILGYAGVYSLIISSEAESTLSLDRPGGIVGLALYLGSCAVIIGFASGMRRAQERAEASTGELAALKDRLALELADMRRLHMVSTRLLDQFEFVSTLREVLLASIELLRADKGNVQLLDKERGVLTIAAQVGFSEEFLDRFGSVPGSYPSAETVMSHRKRVIVENVFDDPLYAELAPTFRAHGFVAFQSTPLFGAGDLLGILNIHFREPHRPSERELGLLDLYAQQAERAIERAQAKAMLQVADRRKDEFLATLSHELRNPLASIRNSVEVLRLTKEDAAAVERARRVIERQVEHMAHLLDDLLDLSRITSGIVRLRKERIDLRETIRGALESCRPSIDAARHKLFESIPPEPIFLEADATRLSQVFSNLLSNACKYTPEGGRIWLSAESVGDEALVRVRDDGIGIDPQMIPRVFEMFTQLDRGSDPARQGLGIGLALAHRMAEMHGGSIVAQSGGAGCGSEFIVRLPIQPPDPARPLDTGVGGA